MSTIHPVKPRRATSIRSSHLRNVNNGSGSTTVPSQPWSRASTPGVASSVIKDTIERRCALSVHDEQHEKEDILINLDFFAGSVKPGDFVAIVALKTDSGVRDFQGNAPSSKKRRGESRALETA